MKLTLLALCMANVFTFAALPALLTLSTLSSAQAQTEICLTCERPPSAANPNDPFPIDLAVRAFEAGRLPRMEQLAGKWVEVGAVSSKEVPTKARLEADGYDSEGFLSDVDVYRNRLEFKNSGLTGEKDFSDQPIVAPASVTISNEYKPFDQQGPNEIMLSESSRSACFSFRLRIYVEHARRMYPDQRTALSTEASLFYECRLMQNNARRMICAYKYEITPAALQKFIPELRLWNGRVITYRAYVKK